MIVIMIDGSEKHNFEGGRFELQSSQYFEKRSKRTLVFAMTKM